MRFRIVSLLVVILILLLPSIALATYSCSGGSTSYTGFNLPGEDWQAGQVYKCSKTYSLTLSSGETATGNVDHPYLATYTVSPGIQTDVGANALYFPISLPTKYKSCETTYVDFKARVNDATGLLLGNSFSSSNQYVNALLTNWKDDANHRNCLSKTLRAFGKHGLNSMMDYASGHDGYSCLSGNIKDYYMAYDDFSISVNNAGDDGTGFMDNPVFRFYYKKSNESCNNIDDDCDGTVDNYSGQCGSSDVGECSFGSRTCAAGSWGSCVGDVGPVVEVCDGLDNDCDGTIDNGFDCVKGSTNCEADCSFSTQINGCSGTTKPANSEWNYGSTNGSYTQTWDGDSWEPGSMNYFYSETETECAWQCTSGNYYYNGECRSDTETASCSGSFVTNAGWNDGGRNGTFQQLCSGGSCVPASKSAVYDVTSGECKWDCLSGFHYDSGSCISDEKSSSCSLGDFNDELPENASWNNSGGDGEFTQSWSGSSWLPLTKEAFYSPITMECAFNCTQSSKSCDLDVSKYCGNGVVNCENGYWGDCEIGSAVACSVNQFCDTGSCQFCGGGTKNCDLNLDNGCEASVFSDATNCGSCGNVCGAGQVCLSGSCIGGTGSDVNVDELNLCENVSCGVNSSCNSSSGACVCSSGFNNCDGDLTNGCEKEGSCNTANNGDDPEEECFSDSDCNPWEVCSDDKCVDPTEGGTTSNCLIDSDCDDSKYCLSGFCAPRICGENYIAINHSCICPKDLCGDSCHDEEGICCSNIWNPGINACGYSVIDAEEKVLHSGNDSAINLVEDAKNSIASGNVLKGKTEAMLGELKADLILAGRNDLEEEYLEAKVALDEGRYEDSQELIIETSDELGNTPDLVPLILGILVVLAVIGGAAFWYFKLRNNE